MSFDPQQLENVESSDVPVRYVERDAILYALGVGLGRDPDESRELRFVSELRGLHTLPTFASMLVPPTLLDDCGLNAKLVLHRRQGLTLYRPLPPAAELKVSQRVTALYDRGSDCGAEICVSADVRRLRDDVAICTLENTVIARGDGGFGGAPPAPREVVRTPRRDPDLVCDLPVRHDQALLFRLSGDYNPLHVDALTAREAGFDAPILHGRCTYGVACHAVLRTVCDYDFTLIRRFDARFRKPVYPGDVITTEMWQDGNRILFRCSVAARNVVVLDCGLCELAD